MRALVGKRKGESVVLARVLLGSSELLAMGLNLPEGAVLHVHLDLERCRHLFRRALSNKGGRTVIDGGALTIGVAAVVAIGEEELEETTQAEVEAARADSVHGELPRPEMRAAAGGGR